MKDLDIIVLNADIPEFHLKKGDMGTIVFTHAGGEAFEYRRDACSTIGSLLQQAFSFQ